MDITINKILVPIDFSEYSKASLRYAVSFAKTFNAEIFLIYVVEPIIYPPDFSMGQIAIPSMDIELDKRAEVELQKLIDTEINDSLKTDIIIRTGKPFIEIIEAASENDIDLIIIATHGHSGVEHILFGSTAEKVVRKAPCPVLTLREPIKGFNLNSSKKKEEKS